MTALYLANVYGEGAYGARTYNASSTSTGGGSTGGSSSGGVSTGGSNANTGTGSSTSVTPQNNSANGNALLTNTGFDIVVIASLAAVVALMAIIVRIWKKPKISP